MSSATENLQRSLEWWLHEVSGSAARRSILAPFEHIGETAKNISTVQIVNQAWLNLVARHVLLSLGFALPHYRPILVSAVKEATASWPFEVRYAFAMSTEPTNNVRMSLHGVLCNHII
jgi:hypothetical protein